MAFGKEPVRLGMQLTFGGVRGKSRVWQIGKYLPQTNSLCYRKPTAYATGPHFYLSRLENFEHAIRLAVY